MDQGVRIRIFGQRKLLPLYLQKLLIEVEQLTKENARVFLNVCFAYTSRQEMTSAVDSMIKAKVNPKEISEETLQSFFWSRESSEPDLLIRTSGELRLSDFLLWQSHYTVISFIDKLWPQFSIWDLFKAVFFYQRYSQTIMRAKRYRELERKELKPIEQEFQEETFQERDIRINSR